MAPTMLVTMTETREASPDGTAVQQLLQGSTYEVHSRLGERLIARGLAIPANSRPVRAADGGSGDDGAAPGGGPLDGLNAKDAAARVAELTLEQLDLIVDEKRKTVLDAVAFRRAELLVPEEGNEA